MSGEKERLQRAFDQWAESLDGYIAAIPSYEIQQQTRLMFNLARAPLELMISKLPELP